MKSDCFLHWITQLLIWHWETQSYAQHVAFDNAYKSFKKLIDKTQSGSSTKRGLKTRLYARQVVPLASQSGTSPKRGFTQQFHKFKRINFSQRFTT